MTCDKYKQEIALLASGALPESDRYEVERHVSACESCRSEYEALRRLCDQIRGLAGEDDKAEVPVGLPERLEESFVTAATGSLLPAGRWTSISRRSVRWLLVAAAACILIGLAVWMVEKAENGGNRTRQERETAIVVAPTPHIAAKWANLPRASCIVYYRAWALSPDALDRLLTRDAAVLLRPEPIQTELDVRSLLKTMNQIEEEHNEKHGMRGSASGAVV